MILCYAEAAFGHKTTLDSFGSGRAFSKIRFSPTRFDEESFLRLL
jgi:hypothetical protein